MVAVISKNKKKTIEQTNKLFANRFRKPTKQFGQPADLLFNKHG